MLSDQDSDFEENLSDTIIDLKFGRAIEEGDTENFVSAEEILSKIKNARMDNPTDEEIRLF